MSDGTPMATGAATPPTVTRRPAFDGSGGQLFGIYVVNGLLTIVTFGIYSFWGKTRVRNYLWGRTAFDGDRFAYHGTGGELFRGWLKAYGLLVVLGFVALLVMRAVSEALGIVVIYGGAAAIFPLAVLGSRKYRLSRTSWRGIRFSFRGRAGPFLAIFIPGILFTVLTLGFYYPFFHARVRAFLVNGSYFGSEAFRFDGRGGDIFWRYVLALFLTPLTLGIYWAWYTAFLHRYYWAHTSFANARFHSTVTGGDTFILMLTNALLLIFTLGIAYPWVRTRTVAFHAQRLFLVGPEDFAAIRQEALPATATGEGLSQLLDVDLMGADFFGL